MAAPGADLSAPLGRARASARVGVLGQQVPGWQVEVAQAPLVAPAVVVVGDASDEVSQAREARQLPASWLEREVMPSPGSFSGGLGSFPGPPAWRLGPAPRRRRSPHRTTPSVDPEERRVLLGHLGGVRNP